MVGPPSDVYASGCGFFIHIKGVDNWERGHPIEQRQL
jgi:hypothetical protein